MLTYGAQLLIRCEIKLQNILLELTFQVAIKFL